MIRELVAFCREHGCFLISYKVYEEIVFEGTHISPARFGDDGCVVSVYGFSKTYAMTGWRVGYVVASEEVAKIIAKWRRP